MDAFWNFLNYTHYIYSQFGLLPLPRKTNENYSAHALRIVSSVRIYHQLASNCQKQCREASGNEHTISIDVNKLLLVSSAVSSTHLTLKREEDIDLDGCLSSFVSKYI